MALDINTAGCELVKAVLSLYRSAKYFREKEVLATMLLDRAIEAGRLTNEVGLCEESEESGYAQRALEELSKAMFALKLMAEDCVYPQRKVQPVAALGEELKALLKLYVKEEEKPLPPAQPVPRDDNEQLTIPVENDGGFNDVYTGKV